MIRGFQLTQLLYRYKFLFLPGNHDANWHSCIHFRSLPRPNHPVSTEFVAVGLSGATTNGRSGVAETSFTLAATVAAGGALGALGRYLVISWFGHRLGTGFPYGTLAVNATGSLLLGAFIALGASQWRIAPDVQAFVAIGVLGAFTTVSTFALDTAYLAGQHRRLLAGAYVVLSVALSLAGAAMGYYLARAAFA